MNDKRKFVFGPVVSRRLGRSLGVDPVPFKTCTYDCIYCQLGKTARKTAEIKEYVKIEPVISELKRAIDEFHADYITLSGSGEPTLNSGLGEMIREIKKITAVPVCVLTNGSLLSREEVRERLREADLVIPSLDASSAETFKVINRPHPSVKFPEMAEGIRKFRETFNGKLYLEIMIIDGLNDSEEEINGFIPLIKRINPDIVQINTVARPPAYRNAGSAPPEKLRRIRELFGDKAEIIVPGKTAGGEPRSMLRVLEIIGRRPLSADDISIHAGLNRNEAAKCLASLVKEGVIENELVGDELYYTVKHGEDN